MPPSHLFGLAVRWSTRHNLVKYRRACNYWTKNYTFYFALYWSYTRVFFPIVITVVRLQVVRRVEVTNKSVEWVLVWFLVPNGTGCGWRERSPVVTVSRAVLQQLSTSIAMARKVLYSLSLLAAVHLLDAAKLRKSAGVSRNNDVYFVL